MKEEGSVVHGWRPSGRRRVLVAAGSLIALTVALAATVAWACAPQPLISLEPRSSGPSGTEVTVKGVTFKGPVEIRWNSIDGPLLGTAKGPHFTTPVTIPNEPEGLYVLIAFERDAEGTVGGKALTSFLVRNSGDPSSSASPPSAETSGAAHESASPAHDAPDGQPPSVGLRGVALTPASALLGAGLLALGGVGGSVMSRRRSRHGPR